MHGLEKKICGVLRRQNLVAVGDTVVAGVSGGPDSMALLHVLAALRGTLGFSLVAVYVDHGLRPREAAQEAALVRESAGRLGLEGIVAAADVRELAKDRRLSLEHAGRLLRYELLRAAAAPYAAWKIAVGHTADDQAEEVLLRLIRGTGRKGLSGMATLGGEHLIRPFLGVTKETLLAYLADRSVAFREDSSNRDRRFLRNRVRLDLLPYLEEHFHAGVRTTLRQTAAILAEEEHYLEAVARRSFERMIRAQGDGLSLGISALMAEPVAIQRRVVEQILVETGASFSFRQIEQVRALADKMRSGAELHLAGGLRVERRGGRLHFTYPGGRGALRGNLSSREGADYEIPVDGPGVYPLPGSDDAIVLDLLAGPLSSADLRDSRADYLDLAEAPFPYVLRPPRPGDRFFPLGAPGTKKLGDWFTDQKVEKFARRGPLLLTGGRIALVAGRRVAQWARVTPASRQVVRVRFQFKGRS